MNLGGENESERGSIVHCTCKDADGMWLRRSRRKCERTRSNSFRRRNLLLAVCLVIFTLFSPSVVQAQVSSANKETIEEAFHAALSLLAGNSSTSSSSTPITSLAFTPDEAKINADNPAVLISPTPTAHPSTTTTDVYSRALRYLNDREKRKGSKNRRLNSASPQSRRSRPKVNRISVQDTTHSRVRLVDNVQDVSIIAPTQNITRRIDENVEVEGDGIGEKELEKMTDVMVNMTLDERVGSGRAIDGGFSSIFSRFTRVLDLGRVVREIETSVMTSVSCTACRAGVGLLFHYVQSGRTNQEIAHAAVKLCVNLKMQTSRVCSGIIGLYVDEVVEVLKGVILTSNEICALVVGESCGSQITPAMQWSVSFPPVPKPPFTGYPEPKPDAPRLKVLQISDTHWDPFYEPGTNAECNEPLCCRATSGPKPPRPHLGAGLWGDYRKCDTPRHTMESMFDHISRVHQDIDYIIWTGDIPAHDVWNQTHMGNIEIIRETVDMFTQYFPHIPIFPALGNHESVPVNSFAPPWVKDRKFSIDWLYSELEKDWSRWLPETTFRTIREGAFYSTMISPGFKLISINTNYCNNKNWWLLVNSTDPAEELKWLIFELQSSEFAGEKVHIIGHIPPGHADCMATWSRNYYQIISRFENTIAAQFFGHTHYDELEIFYPPEEPFRPSSVAYVGPSVTPYSNLNPGYRIYYVDGDYASSTRTVVDHETWITDLSDANRMRAKQLTWYKLYTAKEAYGMSSLNPGTWDDLVMAMYRNKRLFNLYYRFYNKNSPVAPECDDECVQRLLCDARSGKSHAREELCRPRPVHVRTSRGGLQERPQSRLSTIFDTITSAISSLFGFITYPFGFG